MRHGVVLPNWVAGDDVDLLIEAAVAAERGGWDGVFLADHLVFPPPSEVGAPSLRDKFWSFPDPWITLSAIATRTKRVVLGTWVTPVPRRQPWQMARDLATLDRISGGRVLLGVGLGRRPDYQLFGEPWDFPTLAGKADEALTLLDQFWGGDPVQFEGDYYTVDGVALLPVPVQRPRIPIVVGGLWPKKGFIRRGARWDGIVPHFPGDGVFPSDGEAPERHVSALVSTYRDAVDQPGEVFLPHAPPQAGSGYRDLCLELGATWLYTAKHDGEWSLDPDVLLRGPDR